MNNVLKVGILGIVLSFILFYSQYLTGYNPREIIMYMTHVQIVWIITLILLIAGIYKHIKKK